MAFFLRPDFKHDNPVILLPREFHAVSPAGDPPTKRVHLFHGARVQLPMQGSWQPELPLLSFPWRRFFRRSGPKLPMWFSGKFHLPCAAAGSFQRPAGAVEWSVGASWFRLSYIKLFFAASLLGSASAGSSAQFHRLIPHKN